jgi:cysteinyl-tRNA synthetase
MVELITTLVAKGHAYPAEDGSGDVYFDVRSWPAYGELTHQRIEDMEAAEDADPRGKRDPRDFALWKGWKKDSEPETAAWPSPWGPGRPGWHIECSAMAGKYLGPAFDIHGGGVDLRFPHHENEQAQSRAAGHPFASYWLHNAWITTAGEKMSKSLGNSVLVSEMVQRWRPIVLRYYLGTPHYRSTIEYSEEALCEAETGFNRIEGFVQRVTEQHGTVEPAPHVPPAFAEAMDDDFGVPQALAVVHTAVRQGNAALAADDKESVVARLAEVRAMLGVLGLDPLEPQWAGPQQAVDLNGIVDALVQLVLEQRQAARERKDYVTSDAIRDCLTQAGITIEDRADSSRWTLS